MKRAITLNKQISCEYICFIIQDMLNKESNIDDNKIIVIDIVSCQDNISVPLIEHSN